ncbi:MAG TPA: hypothetical protein VHW66_18325 [Stellaceae bacterium]|jgi:hypothetical protein|nr:hypothetical protein [Stellaceae bacterium]
MRWWLAMVALILAIAAPARADQIADAAAALARVPAALDGAETAIAACPQPIAAMRARKALFDARAMLTVARSSPDAMVALNQKMEFLRETLETCLAAKRIGEQYHARCQGDVRLGMSAAEVRQTTWCEPVKVMVTETADHRREEWIYTNDSKIAFIGRPLGFLYFTDGKLTSIERDTSIDSRVK